MLKPDKKSAQSAAHASSSWSSATGAGSQPDKRADRKAAAKLQASVSTESLEIVKACAIEMGVSVPEYLRRSVELMMNLQKFGTKSSMIKLVGLKDGGKKDVISMPLFPEKI